MSERRQMSVSLSMALYHSWGAIKKRMYELGLVLDEMSDWSGVGFGSSSSIPRYDEHLEAIMLLRQHINDSMAGRAEDMRGQALVLAAKEWLYVKIPLVKAVTSLVEPLLKWLRQRKEAKCLSEVSICGISASWKLFSTSLSKATTKTASRSGSSMALWLRIQLDSQRRVWR